MSVSCPDCGNLDISLYTRPVAVQNASANASTVFMAATLRCNKCLRNTYATGDSEPEAINNARKAFFLGSRLAKDD